MYKRFIALLHLTLFASGLSATPISGLFNTGVITHGTQVADADGVLEPHWLQNGNSAFTYNINRMFGGTIYIPETLTGVGSDQSRWISANGTGVFSGNRAFTLSFNLGPDAVASTAVINGRWATDNCGSASLNGGPAFSTISDCSTSTSYTAWTPFTINSGFTQNINTLTFDLQNVSGPGAIRIEFLSSDVQTPEPSTLALVGGALIAFGWRRSRRPAA